MDKVESVEDREAGEGKAMVEVCRRDKREGKALDNTKQDKDSSRRQITAKYKIFVL